MASSMPDGSTAEVLEPQTFGACTPATEEASGAEGTQRSLDQHHDVVGPTEALMEVPTTVASGDSLPAVCGAPTAAAAQESGTPKVVLEPATVSGVEAMSEAEVSKASDCMHASTCGEEGSHHNDVKEAESSPGTAGDTHVATDAGTDALPVDETEIGRKEERHATASESSTTTSSPRGAEAADADSTCGADGASSKFKPAAAIWASKLKRGLGRKAGELKRGATEFREFARTTLEAEASQLKKDAHDLAEGVREGVQITAQDTKELREKLAASARARGGFRGILGVKSEADSQGHEQDGGAGEGDVVQEEAPPAQCETTGSASSHTSWRHRLAVGAKAAESALFFRPEARAAEPSREANDADPTCMGNDTGNQTEEREAALTAPVAEDAHDADPAHQTEGEEKVEKDAADGVEQDNDVSAPTLASAGLTVGGVGDIFRKTAGTLRQGWQKATAKPSGVDCSADSSLCASDEVHMIEGTVKHVSAGPVAEGSPFWLQPSATGNYVLLFTATLEHRREDDEVDDEEDVDSLCNDGLSDERRAVDVARSARRLGGKVAKKTQALSSGLLQQAKGLGGSLAAAAAAGTGALSRATEPPSTEAKVSRAAPAPRGRSDSVEDIFAIGSDDEGLFEEETMEDHPAADLEVTDALAVAAEKPEQHAHAEKSGDGET